MQRNQIRAAAIALVVSAAGCHATASNAAEANAPPARSGSGAGHALDVTKGPAGVDIARARRAMSRGDRRAAAQRLRDAAAELRRSASSLPAAEQAALKRDLPGPCQAAGSPFNNLSSVIG